MQFFSKKKHQGERFLRIDEILFSYIKMVPSIGFQTFYVQAFKIVVDSWKFSMLLIYIVWDDWVISMISGSNQQLQQQLEYTLLKPDCKSWWISKMQSGREDTLEERYTIKLCFKLGKMTQKRMLYSILRVYKYTREHNQLIMTISITNEYTSL